MKRIYLVLIAVAITAVCSSVIYSVGNTIPRIVSVSSWVYPDDQQIFSGGTVNTGNVIRMYTQVSDAKTASKNLAVAISYRPQGGSWTTSQTLFNSTSNYWYTDWSIPVDATPGLYDVKVLVVNGSGGSASSTITGQFNVAVNPNPIIVYVSSWVYPDNQQIDSGGTVYSGKTLKIYTQVSDVKTASKNLAVAISCRPQGGSWITPQSLFNSTSNYWYTDWSIPIDATPGLYDVNVNVDTPDMRSTVNVISNVFNVVVNPSPVIIYVRSWVDPENQFLEQGGNVSTGKSLEMYAQVSDAKTASKDLTVNISYRPQGGSWTTPAASYNPTYDYWYINWTIPSNATTGSYDVGVDVANQDHRSTTSTISNAFNIRLKPSVLVIYEDEASFWTPASNGSGRIDISAADQSGTVHNGTSTLRYQIVAGTKASVDIYHNYTSSQDWSGYGALDFWWYGQNTGARFDIRILGPDLSNQFSSSFADDFMGWQKVTLPMGSFIESGSPKWWNVTQIQIGTSAITPRTWYLDTTTVEPAAIVYVRSWVSPENQPLELGGNVSTGKSLEMYAQVSDAKTASANLTVAISYRPQGGSWTTPTASYNPTYDYWYINWTIPSNATTGSYDVKVDMSTPEHKSTTSTTSNAFNIRLKPSVLVIYEDEASFWTPISGGSGGIDISVADQSGTVHSGTSALRYQIIAGTKASVDIYHNYTSSQDWSGYGALDFWWYGQNTGARLDVHIFGPDLSNQFSSSFADDFMGWQKVTLPMGSFTSTGSPKWWNVTQIQIGTSAITPTTWYLDTTTVEPASIVYVKSWVSPDNQPVEQGGTVSTGKSLEMYAQVSDAKTASKDLTVNISYRPQGGSWTTPAASYDPTYDYWYIIWTIPSNATTGSYDVKVDMSTPDYRSTKSTIFNAFNVCNYVLSMPFANASVPVKDLSGYGNDGTPYNVTWQSNYGGCYSFNGVNSYINRQNMTGLSTTQFSFSFWSKQSGTSSNYMHLIGLFGDHRATIFVAPNTYRYYYKFSNISDTSYENTIGTLDSGWHYIALVLDGSRLMVYVDGFEMVNIRAPGVINKIDDSLFIGTSGTGASPDGNYFNGLLDEVRIYGRVLSAGDVLAEFNAGKGDHGIS